jgi:hypothetical protein
MDVEPYRYQKFISDIAGQDIHTHKGEERRVIDTVRNWLRLELDPRVVKVPGGGKIFQRYQDFQNALPALCDKLDWNPKQLPFADFSYAVAAWINQNSI